MTPDLRAFPDADALFDALAVEVADRLSDGGTLVCAGGTTPAPLYERLSRAPLPWTLIQVTLSDERWLPAASPDSNARLIRDTLLQGPASAASFQPLTTADPTPEAAQAELGRAIAALPRPFAVTLLGMGEDLHTASLFPGAEGLEAALDVSDPALVRAIRPKVAAGSTARISLTLRALLNSRLIVLILKGEAKREALNRALKPGPVAEAPVRGVLHQSAVPVHIYWTP